MYDKTDLTETLAYSSSSKRQFLTGLERLQGSRLDQSPVWRTTGSRASSSLKYAQGSQSFILAVSMRL